jgi:predicted Zn-dependent peptidase
MFTIEAVIREGKDIYQFEAELDKILYNSVAVKEEDLIRVKNKFEADSVYQRTTLLNKAMGLAISDALGDPEFVNKEMDIFNSITLDELISTAEKYLRPENSNTLYYLPEEHA